MNHVKAPIGAILKVNGYFLQAFLLGGTAWLIWPSNPKWWGFGLLSVLLAVATVGSLFAAFRSMAKLYFRERELSRFSATARTPVPSDLANQDTLKNSGMLDD